MCRQLDIFTWKSLITVYNIERWVWIESFQCPTMILMEGLLTPCDLSIAPLSACGGTWLCTLNPLACAKTGGRAPYAMIYKNDCVYMRIINSKYLHVSTIQMYMFVRGWFKQKTITLEISKLRWSNFTALPALLASLHWTRWISNWYCFAYSVVERNGWETKVAQLGSSLIHFLHIGITPTRMVTKQALALPKTWQV